MIIGVDFVDLDFFLFFIFFYCVCKNAKQQISNSRTCSRNEGTHIGLSAVNGIKMKHVITKVVVKELEKSDSVENSLQVNCESIADFENMEVEDILLSGGIRKYVFFLRNCADKKDVLKKALLDKECTIVVYTFEVSEIVDGKTSIKVVDDGEVTGTYTSLTYVLPCKEGFQPTEQDITSAEDSLAAQVERRIMNGTYELVD